MVGSFQVLHGLLRAQDRPPRQPPILFGYPARYVSGHPGKENW